MIDRGSVVGQSQAMIDHGSVQWESHKMKKVADENRSQISSGRRPIETRIPSRVLRGIGTLTHNQKMSVTALREHVGLESSRTSAYVRLLMNHGYLEYLERGLYALTSKGIEELPMLISRAQVHEKQRKNLTDFEE